MNSILIYGGSFDPPHLGHINTACAVQQKFAFDKFLFVPCKQSVLKNKSLATSEQRLDMLKLALAPYSKPKSKSKFEFEFEFEIDTREIDRDTPSYMVDTLESFHQDKKNINASFTLLLGMDAFLELPRWHQWEKILTLCDLLVMQRAGIQQNQAIPLQLKSALNTSSCKLNFIEAGDYPIASSTLRERIKAHEPLEKNLLPEAVYKYIKAHQLYQSLQNHI
ncbi:MAG: nicotinate (nicotinamide) nucleotide adenylyltransferase [Legionellaceae bacterium]|nr:nicotinate (nicotinamide) nucleotide adenylyltransferase [Legionellaceae bacterium]